MARIARKAKAIKLAKRDKAMDIIRKALTHIYDRSREIVSTMECVIHAEEYCWLRSDRRVYFPVDQEMADNIARGSYNIKDESALYDGVETFILNLPQGLAFNGNDNGSGLLVNVSPHDARAEAVYGAFMKWIGQPPIKVVMDGSGGNFTIMVGYQEDIHSRCYMRIAIPSFNAVKILQMNNVKQYSEYMVETNRFNYVGGYRLSGAELAYQYEMLRFVCGFLVYKKALPHRVMPGLPGHFARTVSTPLTKKRTDFVVKHPHAEHEISAGHYRSWHFRQLMDKRYYRGEHANKPIGSRVVFVSDSFVVRDVDARTVQG